MPQLPDVFALSMLVRGSHPPAGLRCAFPRARVGQRIPSTPPWRACVVGNDVPPAKQPRAKQYLAAGAVRRGRRRFLRPGAECGSSLGGSAEIRPGKRPLSSSSRTPVRVSGHELDERGHFRA